MPAKENEKQFDLKAIELRLVESLQQSYFGSLSNTLSFIALERLAYPVTSDTQFRIEEGKLYIHEAKKEEEVVTTSKKGK
jgi:hypothetical protein